MKVERSSSQPLVTSEYCEIFSSRSQTSLHMAVSAGKDFCVDLLLMAGANPNLKDNEGCAALHVACGIGKMRVRPGSTHFRVDEPGLSFPVHEPILLRVVDKVLSKGALPNERDLNGNTPLHWTATNSSSKIAMLLLKAGASVTLKNKRGQTPIYNISKRLVDNAKEWAGYDGRSAHRVPWKDTIVMFAMLKTWSLPPSELVLD
jgi:ankyrin repeat protein